MTALLAFTAACCAPVLGAWWLETVLERRAAERRMRDLESFRRMRRTAP